MVQVLELRELARVAVRVGSEEDVKGIVPEDAVRSRRE